MKKFIALFAVILLVAACSKEKPDSKFSYKPEAPKSGDNVEVIYYPTDENINDNNVFARVYFFSNDLPEVEEVEMSESGSVYSASVEVKENAKAAFVLFKFGDESDNNDGKGYVIKFADENGEIYKDADVAINLAKSYWGNDLLELDIDYQEAVKNVNQAFYNKSADKALYTKAYFQINSKADPEYSDLFIEDEVRRIMRKDDPSVEELDASLYAIERYNLKIDKAPIEAKLYEKDPKHTYFARKDAIEVAGIKNEEAQQKQIEVYLEKYDSKEDVEFLHGQIANSYYRNNEIEKFDSYIEKHPNAASSEMLNSVAWTLAEKDEQLDKAQKYAEKAIELTEKEIVEMKDKPSYRAPSSYKSMKTKSLGNIYDTYAYILELQEKNDEALAAYKKSNEYLEGENPEINERYIGMLVKTENYKDAYNLASDYIKKGLSTEKMVEHLEEAYPHVKGSDDGFDMYVDQLFSEADANIKKDLKDKIMNEPAPEFTLKDLDGNEVSLNDFKGQTVVVDFWATWCGPCIQSFPGMQQAVDKYDDVKFLFVNTWENFETVEEKKDNAEKFVESNDYDFHVLIDGDDKVIAKYGVSGIPTKFIIDKNGNIRFKSVGFSGNNNELISELGMMFDMIK